LCVIIGDPVAHSLSPQMHNAAYAAAGLGDAFVYVAARVQQGELAQAVAGMKAMGFRGLTCTIPHKVAILGFLDRLDPVAQSIGAVNTVVQEDGELIGYNTDWLGIVEPLCRRIELSGKRVAIVGAGGTTRAAIAGCQARGCGEIVVYNRTLLRAERLAEEFAVEARPLSDMASCPQDVAACDVIIQTTSVGMGDAVGQSVVPPSCLREGQVVLDAIYTPFDTRLLLDAAERGAHIVRGAEMFLYQGVAQYEHYTGQPAPADVMERVICEHFGVPSLMESPA
jgi:shikimate dehydrogenase